ncbi:uncharacterized protein LODBEIA_P27260 [Lodderomyces beijingensis]|uniref:Nudix hydrolase domain-containing protein n=1 Tax=Lodderomyces beijingensis TaxID=1775926 RepID=A0ABP0ZK21_9ASCO
MTIKVSYTLGFIRCPETNKVLLLNRNKPPWMGKWNGIGGKLEPNETPVESMYREAEEETGLDLSNFRSRGVLTWEIAVTNKKDAIYVKHGLNESSMPVTGGLYLFTADITKEQFENYRTPLVYNDEGILDWKDLEWITYEFNMGVVDNVKFIFQHLFDSCEADLFTAKYENLELVDVQYLPGKNPLCGAPLSNTETIS